MTLLTDEQINNEFAKLPLEWTLLGGTELGHVKNFANFIEAMHYVNQVAKRAEAVNHHPNIVISYSKVELTLTTHSAGGLTKKDFELAQDIIKIG